jgi:CheY-like chemotaxis protein
LIVEDMEASRTSLQVLLELQGYQVMTAVDGAEGLAVARRELPDVALVDIGLPVMDGYELARRLRQEAACQGIYLVALTGYGQAADVERAREAGFDEHIVKPLDHDRLKKLFRRWE